jgi:WD40 repeat protein
LTPSPSLTPTARVIKAGNYSRVFNSESGSSCAAISHDKRYLALGDLSAAIVIWDSIEWRDTVLVEAHAVYLLAFSPDGKSLASGLLPEE